MALKPQAAPHALQINPALELKPVVLHFLAHLCWALQTGNAPIHLHHEMQVHQAVGHLQGCTQPSFNGWNIVEIQKTIA